MWTKTLFKSLPKNMHYVKGKGINKAPAHRFADQVDPMTNQLGVLLSLLHAHPTVQVILHEHEAGLAEGAGGHMLCSNS